MKQLKRFRHGYAASLLGLAWLAAPSSAAILGFNGSQQLAGWQVNRDDSATPIQVIDNDTIQITTGSGNRRSLWHTTPQNITAFEANFTYRGNSFNTSGADQGITLTLQNSSAGVDALGGILGYTEIAPSAAVTIETTNPTVTKTGFYTNGIMAGGSPLASPIDAFAGTDIHVNVRYSGSVVTVNMTQGAVTLPTRNYVVGSLETLLGSPTAYVGFTASTALGATQFLSNFTFVPEPGIGTALTLGLIAFRQRCRL